MLDRLATPAYWEGDEAGQGFGSEADCPYPVGSSERRDWMTGFDNARHRDLNPS